MCGKGAKLNFKKDKNGVRCQAGVCPFQPFEVAQERAQVESSDETSVIVDVSVIGAAEVQGRCHQEDQRLHASFRR